MRQAGAALNLMGLGVGLLCVTGAGAFVPKAAGFAGRQRGAVRMSVEAQRPMTLTGWRVCVGGGGAGGWGLGRSCLGGVVVRGGGCVLGLVHAPILCVLSIVRWSEGRRSLLTVMSLTNCFRQRPCVKKKVVLTGNQQHML
jgi:hypothetical protein